mmetsp:Transcript_123758/g.214544  ORF Transcript_123758/g.214544 Transcript_123758/m.214544 type:complete len:141 (+) Transcript_123758:78-500(+)
MMRLMASSKTPAQFAPKLLGVVTLGFLLAGVVVYVRPAMVTPPQTFVPGSSKLAQRVQAKLHERKVQMGEAKPTIQPSGRLLRRDPPAVASAIPAEMWELSRMIFLGVFGFLALAAFAMQAKGALSQLAAGPGGKGVKGK